MKWKPVRKVAAQIWTAIAGNGAVAGVIAGTDSNWKALGVSLGSSILLIAAGYLTPGKDDVNA